MSLTSLTWSSAPESPASRRICTAALSWAAISAFFNSSLSKSLVTCDDGVRSMIGFSWRCWVNMVREAAKQALRMYRRILRIGAHWKTRRSHLNICSGSMMRSSWLIFFMVRTVTWPLTT